MSLTDDEERNEDNIELVPNKTETSVSSNKMYTYGRELCFILALAITSYAALQKVIPKVSKSPPATPFFHETSLVADFYRGQLGPALSRVVRSDVSFIMFYAPWDAESQLVRQEFDAAAKYYHREVYFAAVNCWQPESECRRQFPKMHHFPVLIVYGLMRGSKGLEYRGPRTMPYMVHFIKSLLHPFSRVEHPSEVTKLMTKYDAVVVGFFDFYGPTGSKGFSMFHSYSIKHLECHPLGNVRFAVSTNAQSAHKFGLRTVTRSNDSHPVIKLYLWNETLEYTGNSYTAESIMEWIDRNLHTIAIWVSPPGVKSNTLSQFVDRGPVLFLFTPRNPFWEENPNFNTLREVALEYFNCHNNSRVMDVIQEISSSQIDSKAKYKSVAKRCEPWIKKKLETLSLYHDHIEQGSILNRACEWKNDSCFCNKSNSQASCKFSIPNSWGETFPNLFQGACCKDKKSNSCSTSKARETTNTKSFMEDEETYYRPFFRSRSEVVWYDERVAYLLDHAKEDRCKQLLHGELLQQAVFPHDERISYPNSVISDPKIQGLACRTNQTISLLALDSLKYHHFAMGLGVDVLSRKDATAVVILHASGETQHVMTEAFSKRSLTELITNYSTGALRRSLRSEPEIKKEESTFQTGQKNASCPPNSICVLDLSSKTFKDVVLDETKNVVVLYHSPSCAFCSSVWHIYLTVARIFTTSPNGIPISNSNITFARIDGDANDLPWEYTMDSYPSILFFPAYRKSDSRIFSLNLPMTVGNIAQFVAANLSPEARITTLLGGCDENCVRRAKVKCLGMIASLLAKREMTEIRIHFFTNEKSATQLTKEQAEDYKRLLFLQHRRISLRLRHLRETYFALNKGRGKALLSTSSRNMPDVESVVASLRKYNRALSVVSADVIERREVNKLNIVGEKDETMPARLNEELKIEELRHDGEKVIQDVKINTKEEL